ncbi:MAG: YggS family pyridoxal phosphate-dependent enzyme [Duncaniella sp.]|nr:YggS family pyridoxal phosphate-dependent enzyme [Duncaniella sp.]
MSVAGNLLSLRRSLPQGVTLVAVSKFHPLELLCQAYDAGQRIFGESRAQELALKAAAMPPDTEWHFIGHLQSNKVRPVVAVASMIHSIDSIRLLRAVDAEACRASRRIKVLLQIHVAREETKFGFTPAEIERELTPELVSSLSAVEIAGVMGMASNTDDTERISRDFASIRSVFDSLRLGVLNDHPEFKVLSMGMSHDWPLAVARGSNMIRVGTTIFGERNI